MNGSSLRITPIYTKESNFEQVMNSHIAALWCSREEGFVTSFDKKKLFWIKLTSPQHTRAIVVVNGRIESAWKYQELFYDLFQQGYDIYSFDHRGQGLSDRLIDNKEMGYVGDYQDYIQDFHTLVEHFSLDGYEKRYLLGHSMGGNIATRYVQTYPKHCFSAIALSAPMFGVNMPKHLKPIALVLSQIMTALAAHPKFAPGQAPYSPKPFDTNLLTQSAVRYYWFRELYENMPQLKVGGASTRWLWQGLMAAKKCHLMTRHIGIPLLLLQAGNDKIVSNPDQTRFIRKLTKTNNQCEMKVIEQSLHELLFEKDHYRNQALDAILSFFARY
ncbi:alpha/beta fold hydrolase [Vibrio ostreicida]|uniref:Alpha/beta fold hydrolase n=1 Tax=Vibrio ostreicida TaxID=526588 RepID=A0ABT8BPW3_9VIBR|nr:alpha/beta fold hydrolase [Vibrio ostreicida]MDN3608773.1 alpha/beta fold hydrolase [Vibrio ostreicida]NPD10793.1 alpha/beta fold hydrolase [Vibrio ostreicida]